MIKLPYPQLHGLEDAQINFAYLESHWTSSVNASTSVPDATGTTNGVIRLAGDLTGTAASPQIAAGAVTDVEVAAANKDGAAIMPSMRTLGTGAGQAMPGNRSVGGYYSNNATHAAGTTITITQATHGLRSSRGIHVQVQDNATGNVEVPGVGTGPTTVSVASNGDVTVTYGSAVAANAKLITLIG